MQHRRPRGRRGRAVLVFFATLVSIFAASTASSAAAQTASLPKLNVAITPSSIAVSGANQAGAVEVVSTGPKETELILFHLNPGVSTASLLKMFEGRGASATPTPYSSTRRSCSTPRRSGAS